MRDVGLRAGVSQALVSYVLSGRQDRQRRASPDVVARVEEAARELGYFPDANARSLRRRRTDRICLMAGRPGNPSVDLLLAHLQQEARRRGYWTIMLPQDPDEDPSRSLELLHQGLADGAVINSWAFESTLASTGLDVLRPHGVPVVVLTEDLAPAGFDVVRATEQAACEEACNHLLDQGRRRIAYLAHDDSLGPVRFSPRYRGFAAALLSHGMKPDPKLVVGGAAEDRVAAYQATLDLLGADPPVDAIFSESDRGAISAIWALRDTGVQVPEKVAVVGFGLLPEGEATRPALTSIGQDRSRISEIADLLFARIEGDGSPFKELVIPSSIVWRGSA